MEEKNNLFDVFDIIENGKIICSRCGYKNGVKKQYCTMCAKQLVLQDNIMNEKKEESKKLYKKWWLWTCIVLTFGLIGTIEGNILKTISLDKTVYNIGINEEVKPIITTNLGEHSNVEYTWLFEDNTVAKVNESGNLIGLKEGTTKVTVKGNNKVEDSAKIVVKYISLSDIQVEYNKYMEIGDKQNLDIKFNPTNTSNKNVTIESSNPKIVSINDNGEIQAIATGQATITIKASDGVEQKIDIGVYNQVKEFAIKESSVTVYKGESKTINLTISPSNAQNTPVKWISSNTEIATVDSKGKVTGKKNGSVKISAICESSGAETSIEVIVKEIYAESITVTGAKSSIKKGESFTLKATVAPNNTTDKNVIWTSSDMSVVTVSNGKVTAIGKGEATITAQTTNGIKQEIDIVVKEKAPIQFTQFSDTMDAYGGVKWYINFKNTSDKTIDWLTIKWYCFDRMGMHVYDIFDNKDYMYITFVDAISTLKPRTGFRK